MPETNRGDEVEKLLSDQKAVEERRQALIAEILKQREAAMQDPDRQYIPPMVLTRQKAMIAHIGERPDWDIYPGFFDPAHCVKALEKHQEVTRILHEAGGLVLGVHVLDANKNLSSDLLAASGLTCCAKACDGTLVCGAVCVCTDCGRCGPNWCDCAIPGPPDE